MTGVQPAVCCCLVVLLALFYSCSTVPGHPAINELAEAQVNYQISLSAGAFEVELYPGNLQPSNRIFMFASGGSLDAVTFEQLVSNVVALDSNDRVIPTPKVTDTQWLLTSPEKVKCIRYSIRPTWTDDPGRDRVLPMLGSRVDEHFVFYNARGVFGFIPEQKDYSIAVNLNIPDHWQVGTSLPVDSHGRLRAQHFGQLFSCPVLAGELTLSADYISGSEVFIYTFSDSGSITSEDLQPMVSTVLNSAQQFIGRLPLDRYHMLFMFSDRQAGGVEFYNSAAFVFEEAPLEKISSYIQDVIAHEYFHLILPFAIRSDASDPAFFFTSQPTDHLWFIEGVTEWASDMMQVRSGEKSLQDYFIHNFREKLFREDFHPAANSLQEISRLADRNRRDYLSVYSRGALAATFLDIHLLDLSYGKRGLIDVLIDLTKDFGPDRPLPEEQFFEILKDYAGPEVESFIGKYIEQTNPLPVEAFLTKIGISYRESRDSEEPGSDLGMATETSRTGTTILWLDPDVEAMGFKRGDRLVMFNQQEWDQVSQQEITDLVSQLLPGTPYTMKLERNGRPIEIKGQTIPKRFRHLFSLPAGLTPSQARLQSAWRKNRVKQF